MAERVDSVPLMLEKAGRSVIIYGGGEVAGRKAEYFSGMELVVVSPSVGEGLRRRASEVVEGPAGESLWLMEGHDIVIAATDDKEVNDIIVAKARFQRKLVNSATGGGNFMIPAVRRREGYLVCASTEGLAPVWAPYVLDMLVASLSEVDDRMCALLIRLREACRPKLPDAPSRRAFLQAAMEDEAVWGLLREGDEEGAFTLASGRLEAIP